MDLTQLIDNARSTVNLLTALSTPVPEDVAAMGPVAKQVYRGAVAKGASPYSLDLVLKSGEFKKYLQTIKDGDNVESSDEKSNLGDYEAVVPLILGKAIEACVANPACRAAGLWIGKQAVEAIINAQNKDDPPGIGHNGDPPVDDAASTPPKNDPPNDPNQPPPNSGTAIATLVGSSLVIQVDSNGNALVGDWSNTARL